MTHTPRITLLAAMAAAACATAGGGSASRYYQADYARPGRAQFSDDAQRAIVDEALIHADRADQASMAGNLDQSRAENRLAADALVKFVDTFPSTEYRLVMRAQAAERYLRAQEFEKAAAQAQRVLDDPEARDVSKAIATRYAVASWQTIAIAEGRAGKIDPPRILTVEKRKGQEVRPRVPPDPWKRFIENADRYQQLAKADPQWDPSPAERHKRGAIDTAQLALIAAQVEFGYDNLEDARRRFEAIIQSWPSRAEVMESAVPYFLQTFLLKRDDAGYEAAVARSITAIKPEAAKAAEVAKAPGAGDEAKKGAEILARLLDDLEKQQQGAGFSAAERLLAAEKLAEAGAAFEKFAAENRTHPDAPNALYNAAVAWERAKEPRKAQSARAALLERYPDTRIAPQATLAQASTLTRQGEHAAAQKLYQGYLEKWGKGPQRCLALQNLGVALESMGKKLEAAKNYQWFARDEACLKEDSNNAVKVVYRGAVLFSDTKKKSDALEMFRVVAGIQGATDTVAKSQVEDAKERVKKGK
jgi:outer membrane protein assembly factor BamD (BamD/ComL family)